MAVQITTYSGLQAAWAAWLARDGDADIAGRADDFLALCENRMYYGKQALPALGIPEHEAIRIPQMRQDNTSFAISNGVAQPDGLLALNECVINVTNASPLNIVDESILDEYAPQTGQPTHIALSGTTFRFWPDPGMGLYKATLRYWGKLASPSPTNPTNWILTNAPGVYLNGGLLEAAIYTQDMEAAKLYAMLYSQEATGLNVNRNRTLNLAHNVRMRLRARTP